MIELAKGQPVITDNRPTIEFYLNLGNVIDVYGREDLVFTRASFREIASRVSGMTHDDQKSLETIYDAMDLYQRGVMYNNRELLLEALAKLKGSDLVRYHLQAGTNYMSALLQEVNANPSNLEALLNLGHAYFQIGKYKKSLGILLLALEQDANHSHANLYTAYSLMELERRQEAKAFFKAATKNNRVQFGSSMRDFALVDLHAKLDAAPKNIGLLNAVAAFYNIKKEYGKSLGYSKKVLEQDSLNKQALKNIIFGYRGRGEPADVLDYGNRYAMVDPDDINLQYIFGEIFAKTLRCRQAVPYLLQVLKKDDTYRNTRFLLNACLSRKTKEEGDGD